MRVLDLNAPDQGKGNAGGRVKGGWGREVYKQTK